MSTSIDNLKGRKIQVYHLHAGPELVTVTVETPRDRIKLGVSIGLQAHSASLDSKEVAMVVLGRGHFNPIVFPAEGPLPELKTGGGRCAAATFEFVAVEEGSRPLGAELTLRGKQYRIMFSKTAQSLQSKEADHIPASVAKVLPNSWPKRSK